ncbi:hypothetical protein Cadr_000020014 [Camelus dromedarius]|uniref:Uncharacterized protein n=1 Tax=Camelus dromedarius TaxID=9838 RepID=A0A5N4D074_CAMDR|nr:hypothetical protein Cadr_000020014 [Camelus dromedarius]
MPLCRSYTLALPDGHGAFVTASAKPTLSGPGWADTAFHRLREQRPGDMEGSWGCGRGDQEEPHLNSVLKDKMGAAILERGIMEGLPGATPEQKHLAPGGRAAVRGSSQFKHPGVGVQGVSAARVEQEGEDGASEERATLGAQRGRGGLVRGSSSSRSSETTCSELAPVGSSGLREALRSSETLDIIWRGKTSKLLKQTWKNEERDQAREQVRAPQGTRRAGMSSQPDRDLPGPVSLFIPGPET